MVEDVHGHEGDVGSVGKVVMHPLTHWLGKKVLWSLEEETSCIKNLWQLPIIPWNGKTPTAATTAAAKATWYGSAPAVNMLRAFGCMVAFHVPKEKRGKLEASGRWDVEKGVLRLHQRKYCEGLAEKYGLQDGESQQHHYLPGFLWSHGMKLAGMSVH
ncbi:hypothetical protein CLOM_g7360 [Closterium sp. NIES-68]|nr:hypothetical protein CLOM_g7360 [Closterium sp. NIES-68]